MAYLFESSVGELLTGLEAEINDLNGKIDRLSKDLNTKNFDPYVYALMKEQKTHMQHYLATLVKQYDYLGGTND